MKALSQEYRYHLKIALVPLVILLFLWRADILLLTAVGVVVLCVLYFIVLFVTAKRRDQQAAKLEKTTCTDDGELSSSSLTSDLHELETQTSEMFGVSPRNVSYSFLAAINALDSVEQMSTFLALLHSLPKEEDCGHLIPRNHESFYLLKLAGVVASVRHKILYEYQRKTGSLSYKSGDRKPLLTQQEMMRPLQIEERDKFLVFCQSADDPTNNTSSYFEERDEFLRGNGEMNESVASHSV